jgi:hypothetical protein
LDEVQTGITHILKPLGFKRKGRVFNRSKEKGLVQVIALQNGPFEIGEGAFGQPSFYGKFTVNLGVHVKEAWDRMYGNLLPRQILRDPDCAIRSRLSWLDAGKDYWWSLDESAETLIDEVGGLLLAVGISFLDRFDTREKIIADFDPTKNTKGTYWPADRMDIAMILLARGDKGSAKRLLTEQVQTSQHLPNHQAYVRELAAKLGLGPLGA